MDIYELINTRKSVRSWQKKPVERALIEKIIGTARLAPSAKNVQEWYIVAVTDESSRRNLGEGCAKQPFVAQAPVVLAICADPGVGTMRCGQPRAPIDAAILIDRITLLAVAEGLGTCWIGSFDQECAKNAIGCPDAWEIIELLPMGYPADPSPAKKNRKKLDEILSWERWK